MCYFFAQVSNGALRGATGMTENRCYSGGGKIFILLLLSTFYFLFIILSGFLYNTKKRKGNLKKCRFNFYFNIILFALFVCYPQKFLFWYKGFWYWIFFTWLWYLICKLFSYKIDEIDLRDGFKMVNRQKFDNVSYYLQIKTFLKLR